jgi:two-component system OmpR family response regulator
VMFLSGLGGLQDWMKGLEAGGDDYLVKPFALAELSARAAAVARRRRPIARPTSLRIAGLELDRLTHEVSRDGRKIELKLREFQVLEYLMLHENEIVTRTMLLEAVWDFHFDPKTSVVESHVSRVRSKVDRGFSQELIHTYRGAGYRISSNA